MSDDKTKTGGQDRKRVSMSEDYEVDYWIQAFDCTRDELKDAVAKVGSMAEDVEAEIRRKRG